MRKLSYIILISLLSFSCKKKGTLKVTVTNVGTGEPMANNGVYITELTNKVDGIGGTTITHNFYSGTTNADGLLYIDKKFDKRYTYEVFVDLPDNWAYVEDISHTMSVGDKYWKNGMDFKIATAAYLKLSIHNVNCQGVGDTIILQRNNLSAPSYDGYSPMSFSGCYDYDASDSAKVPSGKWQYKWTVIRNGLKTYHDTTFLLNEGECAWIKVIY